MSLNRAILTPLKNQRFRRFLLFYLTLVLGALIAEPFYNVYMIRDLGVSYATIGILNALVLGVGIFGYKFWGSVANRFGSKPVLEMLMVPRLLIPFAWLFLTPQNHLALLIVIMVVNGTVFSGLTVAINTLLFGSIPDDSVRTDYFAMWAFASSLVSAAATAMGGFIVRSIGDAVLRPFGANIGGLRVAFLLSSLLLIVPALLVRLVTETNAKPVTYLLGQMLRGNSAAFVFNAFVFSRSRGARSRARAARAMGKSRNPMAVEHLARVMDDLEPSVREQAVRGLGDTRAESAVSHLAATLADEESDIRAEAAESLGRIRHASGINPLLAALDSADSRVAISAARALGDIGGPEVVERLYGRIQSRPGKVLFPSLIDSLSRLGDIRIVDHVIFSLADYTSPVIRQQLLNAVCRVLGAPHLFYTFLSLDEYNLAERLEQMLLNMERRLIRRHPLPLSSDKEEAKKAQVELRKALEAGDYTAISYLAWRVAESVQASDPTAFVARNALKMFAESDAKRESDRPEIFAVVCLGVYIDTLD